MTMSLAPRPPDYLHIVVAFDAKRYRLLVRGPSLPTTITDLLPSCAVRIATVGIFHAFSTVRARDGDLHRRADFELAALLSILSQISTVVLPGSSAGLISETFAGTGPSTPGT